MVCCGLDFNAKQEEKEGNHERLDQVTLRHYGAQKPEVVQACLNLLQNGMKTLSLLFLLLVFKLINPYNQWCLCSKLSM